MAWSLLRSTYSDEETAAAAGNSLVEEGLACCVHVQSMRSLYAWNGVLQDETEWLVEARVAQDDLQRAAAHVVAHHPYDVPMVEALPTRIMHEGYAEWAESQRGSPPPQ